MKKKQNNYKKIKINEEELAITTIGELKENEQSNFVIFILFGIILLFIFLLPTITNLIKKPDEKPDYSLINKEEKDNVPVEENKDNALYYDYSESLSILLTPKITIHHFNLNNNEIIFDVSNNSDSTFTFSNYFLEIYTEDNTLLERVYLSDIEILKNETKTYNYELLNSTISRLKKVKFLKKEITDYPNIILEKNESGEEKIVCTKNTRTIDYIFENNLLTSIKDVVEYDKTNNNYDENIVLWQNKADNLNKIEGISSVFLSTNDNFIVNTIIDLKMVKNSSLEDKEYYKNGTLSKVVKFEMEARGFICK